MSVHELMKLSGVGRQPIAALRKNQWERVTRDVLGNICGALGITLDELFVLYEEDIWFPIRLHRDVTIHIGSNSFPTPPKPGEPVSPTTLDPQSIGAWDFRAFRVITKHLAKLGRDITVRSQEHEAGIDQGYDASLADVVDEMFSAGDHVVIGSPVANPIAEEVVCRMFGVAPYTTSKRDAFPFGFVWDSRRGIAQSSFGWQGIGADFGIAATRTGKLVARRTSVVQGEGDDCALIVTYRVWQEPKHRRQGRDDERMVIAILGYSGAGTYAAAKVATDPRYASALYPSTHSTPLMRVVGAKYTRPATQSTRDTRRVTGQFLVDGAADVPSSHLMVRKDPRPARPGPTTPLRVSKPERKAE